ncbi:MAG: hypothetical protein HZB80_11595 [Deltaproteobacteria bacterium]|nr:hypothetical protein [Deltaproteobacteria bacterium]
MKRFRFRYLPEAKNAIRKLPPAIKPGLKSGIVELLYNPFSGKELVDELSDFRSLAIGAYRNYLPDNRGGKPHRNPFYRTQTRCLCEF